MAQPVEIDPGRYQAVAASSTDAELKNMGGQPGDVFLGVLIIPGTTSPGAVSIKDGGGSSITLFAGGATSVADLKPFFVPVRARSRAGAWSITTGANVTALAVGRFS